MKQCLDKVRDEIKENINLVIKSGRLEEAKILIEEYKKISFNDVEIYSIEAVILILQDKFEEAEIVLKKGLTKDSNNFDLLYNLGYLYEIKNNIIEAKATYNIARIISNKTELIEILNNKMIQMKDLEEKYNVVLFGEYNICLRFKEQFDAWNVIAICNNKEVLNEVINISELKKYNYDFIFVLEDIDKEEFYKKIQKYNNKNVYFIEDFKIPVVEGVDYKISKLLSKKQIDGIITGLSYAEVGIKENLLPCEFINFAFSSQDLYYDFSLLKYLYNFEEVKKSLKYVIINLAYYSFDYDMTRALSKYRIHRYSRYFKKYHNNNDIIGIDITRAFYDKIVTFKEYVNTNKRKENTVLNPNDINGIYEAQRNSSMNYKDTRYENEKILDNYIKFLVSNNIKPIILICPTSFYYRKYFDNNKKVMFYNMLNRINRKYNFQIIDYFDSIQFKDDDFWDYSHLNGRGSEKLTKILSKEIKYL